MLYFITRDCSPPPSQERASVTDADRCAVAEAFWRFRDGHKTNSNNIQMGSLIPYSFDFSLTYLPAVKNHDSTQYWMGYSVIWQNN